MSLSLDHLDIRLLTALQQTPGASQRELAEIVGLSQNACWRRLTRMEEAGIIRGRAVLLDRRALGLDLVVFVMIRTKHHSAPWLEAFRGHVGAIPEVVDFFRIAGNYDYMLKVVTADMASFDGVYRQLISKLDLDTVTSYIAMEAIAENRPLPLAGRRRAQPAP